MHQNHGWAAAGKPTALALASLALVGFPLAMVAVGSAPQDTPSYGSTAQDQAPPVISEDALHDRVNEMLGLARSDLFTMVTPNELGVPVQVELPIDGVWSRVDLHPYSVRSENYQVLEQWPDGTLVPVEPGPVRTMLGSVRGVTESVAGGSLMEDGLHLMIDLPQGCRWWVEPISERVPGAPPDMYVIYGCDDALPHDGACGNDLAIADRGADFVANDGASFPEARGGFCIADLAVDADFEYFQMFGSVAAVESRVNNVINTVNVQYQNDVNITHVLGTIIVRSSEPDPYSSTDSFALLCEFITEWTNNQTGVVRDLAVLFTGKNVDGSVIGRAADIGNTGVCVSSGGCSGGQFDTFGSYCMAQVEFNGQFGCATDLVAHELGHLWGAWHCSCPSFTMNPFITCANQFSAGSINSIMNYAGSRPCLTGNCQGGPGGPANDNCVDAEAIQIGGTTYSTINATTDGPAHASCQFDGQTYNDIWFTFDAPCSGNMTASTCNAADYDTDLVVYDGCDCANLVLLGCNDDATGCGGFTSEVTVPVTGGNCYLVRVGGWNAGDMGTGTLTITAPSSCGPANDNCANASPIGDGGTAFSTINATTDGPAHAACQFDGQTYEDIWYTYSASCTGDLTVSTCGAADYDTDLVVYDGCDCANLALLGCNDDAGGCAGFTSEVTVPVMAGNCYLVRVGGFSAGDEGTGTVTLTCTGTAPANDDCANAAPIADGATAYSTVNATTDGPAHPGSCQFDGQTYEDIWYTYDASCTGALLVSACNAANYDTDLVVYDGCDCANLVLLGCNDDAPNCGVTSELVVPVVAGNCYLIRAGGWNPGDEGDGTLTLTCTGFGPANDDCANASSISDGATLYSTVDATTDGPAHPECMFDGQTYNDIWYAYDASCDGELTVSTCDAADYDTDLVVYDGCDCANLVLLGCNDDAAGCAGFTSELVVPVAAGSCYLVRVGGWMDGDMGNGTVTIVCTPAPPCPPDITGPNGGPDGFVDTLDLLLLLAQWGTPGPQADLTGPNGTPDGTVDTLDLLFLLAGWGPCP